MNRPACEQLDTIFSTVEEIRGAEEALKALKARLATQAQALATIEDKTTRMAAAVYTYWYAPEVNATDISLGATGQPHPSKLLKAVGPVAVGVPCERCQNELPIRSRTEMKDVLERLRRPATRPEGHRVLCPDCEEAIRAERRLEWAAQERRRQKRQHELATMPYAEYLVTTDWQKERHSHLWCLVHETGALRCETCNSKQDLGVYHKTVEGLGGRDDLVLLCVTCRDALVRVGRLAGEPGPSNRVLRAEADQIIARHNQDMGR